MVRSKQYQILAQIANKCSVCHILITDNSTINTTGKEPDGRFETALRAIEVNRRRFFLADLLIGV